MAVLSYTFCFVDLVWVCVYFYIRFDVQCSFWIFLWYVFYHECWEWDVFDISAAVIFTSTNISYLIFSFSCLWQCWVLQTLFLTSRGLMPSGVVVKCCTRWRFFAVDQESVFNVHVLTYLPAWELCSLKNILLHWRLRRNWKKYYLCDATRREYMIWWTLDIWPSLWQYWHWESFSLFDKKMACNLKTSNQILTHTVIYLIEVL